jgi:hypothetical protein
MSETAIQFPKRDEAIDSFRMWAARYFYDDLHDPLRWGSGGGFYHQRVNDAWEAWKVCDIHLKQENERLRNLLREVSKHTLDVPIMTEPGKIG